MRKMIGLTAILIMAQAMPSLTLMAQTESVYTIERFRFENGSELAGMKVGYVTWGRLNEAGDNAILLLPGSSGNRHYADSHIGPGKTYNTDHYFVIAVDPIGGGRSSSPADTLGPDFPRYTVHDMVEAQYIMLTRNLGLHRLMAVSGTSMGAFQALEWGGSYPDFMTGLILIEPAARMDPHFAPIMDAMEAAIKLDPNYHNGHYTHNPTDGIRAAALVFFPWIVSDEFLISLDSAAYQKMKTSFGDGWARDWDANSLLWRFYAGSRYDASQFFGGDMAQTLSRVKAQSLIMYSSTDRTVPYYLTRELEQGLKNAVSAELPSIRGHLAGIMPPGTTEYDTLSALVKSFLNGLEKNN
ncbi:MAG: alpha/beta fold hydrolase [Candidatus Delongbacteria bacterium]|nr:alpha/beta fold hydrolase [Candidatus Delongbacteria bacterium]